MHHVARALSDAGIRVLAPVMAGHAGGTAELVGVPWTEWVTKAGRDLERLAGARRTFVVGCSMGALVACALAHDLPARVDGLVLLAPALELALAGRLAAALGRLPALGRVVVPKAAGSDVRDLEMRARNPCLDGVPLGAVSELDALAAQVNRGLPGIVAPALVVAARHDHTVTFGGARRLARRIGSGPARLLVLEESWHLVGIDVERELCARETVAFLEAIPVPGLRERPARKRPRSPARRVARRTPR